MAGKQENTPVALIRMLNGAGPGERETLWGEFVNRYTPLILHAVRPVFSDHDGRMDAYGFALERLRSEDFARLRTFDPDGSAKFTTWLVVVCRRLAVDLHRRRYGRADRKGCDGHSDSRIKLAQLITIELRPEHVVSEGSAERRVLEAERSRILQAELAALPVRDRLLLRYRFEDERSVKEIQRLMRFPSVFHVYRRLKKVLAELRRSLETRGLSGPEP
jgi:RNA polymerase sigma factor (sigma-70 family)